MLNRLPGNHRPVQEAGDWWSISLLRKWPSDKCHIYHGWRIWISCCISLPAPDVKYSPEGVTRHSSGLMYGSDSPAVWLATQWGTPPSDVSLWYESRDLDSLQKDSWQRQEMRKPSADSRNEGGIREGGRAILEILLWLKLKERELAGFMQLYMCVWDFYLVMGKVNVYKSF